MTTKNNQIKRYAFLLSIFWSIAILCSFWWFYYQVHQGIIEMATAEAHASCEKDLFYREWASSHGGVYVPISDSTPPNPNLLGFPERDIVTPSGRKLTLVNPAYMTRQVFERGVSNNKILRGHIISLKPIRSANFPDPWEEKALKTLALAEGEKEFSELQDIDGSEYLRLVRVVKTEQGCLQCHVEQGYTIGDIRGGISVSVPLAIYTDNAHMMISGSAFTHSFIWFLGIGMIAGGRRAISSKVIELEESEKRYRAIADYTSEWEYWTSPEGKFLYVSPCCEKITGYSKEEFIRDPQLLKKIIHPDDLQRYISHQKTYGLKEYSEPLDFRIITRDGAEQWIEHRCRQMFDSNGTSLGWRASNRDITDRVRVEEKLRVLNEELDYRVTLRTAELERLNNELQSFCYSISHELRAPLARLEGFSEAIAESVAQKNLDESVHYAERIGIASRRLRSVIDNLLLMNRLSREELTLESVNLSKMAHEIVADLLGEEKGRSIKVTVEPDLVVEGDRSMLAICLKNLLGNAVKYTSRTPDAEIEFGRSSQTGETVYFVRDNGVGFDMTYAEKLFEPFCRLHQQMEFEGNGIGLPIVQRIIERHHGRIWADAKEGKGATFYFNLP